MKNFENILIVDDSSTSRLIIQKCLEMAGLQIEKFTFAENGLEALSKLKNHVKVDLIITDINMPKMDGQTFVKILKQDLNTENIPVIVISSIASEVLELSLGALGVHGIIRKPLSPVKVSQVLGDLP